MPGLWVRASPGARYFRLRKKTKFEVFDHDRTRTCNPQIRSLVPYPLGHTVLYDSKGSLSGNITLLFNACCNFLCVWEHWHTVYLWYHFHQFLLSCHLSWRSISKIKEDILYEFEKVWPWQDSNLQSPYSSGHCIFWFLLFAKLLAINLLAWTRLVCINLTAA